MGDGQAGGAAGREGGAAGSGEGRRVMLERAERSALTARAASPSAQPPATTSRRCGPATAAMRARISAPPRPTASERRGTGARGRRRGDPSHGSAVVLGDP